MAWKDDEESRDEEPRGGRWGRWAQIAWTIVFVLAVGSIFLTRFDLPYHAPRTPDPSHPYPLTVGHRDFVTVYVDKSTLDLDELLSWTLLGTAVAALVLTWLARRKKQRLWDENVLGVKKR